MNPAPTQPKIYHITHLRNLAQIIATGGLWSDAQRVARGLDCKIVGMPAIKRRRLEELEVSCHPTTKVGQYVPFYFCPRSILLYMLHQGNHPDLDYREGQQPIVHLQADLRATVHWVTQRENATDLSDAKAKIYHWNDRKRMFKEQHIQLVWDLVHQ